MGLVKMFNIFNSIILSNDFVSVMMLGNEISIYLKSMTSDAEQNLFLIFQW
jgi:hypothetical protein